MTASALTAETGLAATESRQTNQHYSLSPHVFRLFLDPNLKYSSALYKDGDESLEQAQIRKLEFIARQLELRSGAVLLDIGCGWGSLVLFAAERYGCQAVGVTPSPEQAVYIRREADRRGLSGRVRVYLAPFEEAHLPRDAFDAVAMVGSIVHLRDKAVAIEQCYRLCRRRGRLYVSETCFRSRRRYLEFTERPGTRFVRDNVFGRGDMVPLSAHVGYAEDAGFSLTGLTDLTEHYRRTIEDWQANVRANTAALEALQPGIASHLQQYLETANAGWGFTTKHYALVATKVR